MEAGVLLVFLSDPTLAKCHEFQESRKRVRYVVCS